MTGRAIKYIAGVGACQRKCQDDFANKKGNGFLDDATNCIIGSSLDASFNTCVTNAQASSKLTTVVDPLCSPIVGPFLAPLLDKALSSATNSSYDRIDLGLVNLVTVITNPLVGNPLGATAGVMGAVGSLADRLGAGKRAAFGSCPSFGNGVVEDYEECDTGPLGSVLCGTAIPGTLVGACQTVTSVLPASSPGRCPRP